jgi:hypothetical protein
MNSASLKFVKAGDEKEAKAALGESEKTNDALTPDKIMKPGAMQGSDSKNKSVGKPVKMQGSDSKNVIPQKTEKAGGEKKGK